MVVAPRDRCTARNREGGQCQLGQGHPGLHNTADHAARAIGRLNWLLDHDDNGQPIMDYTEATAMTKEELEERVKSVVMGVAMTVDYTERLHSAVQEIMSDIDNFLHRPA